MLLTARKLALRTILAFVLLVVVMAACTLIGTEHISLKTALTGLTSQETVNTDYEILVRIRLPRILFAAIIGAALASSGVMF